MVNSPHGDVIQVSNLICVEKFSEFPQLGRFTLRTEGDSWIFTFSSLLVHIFNKIIVSLLGMLDNHIIALLQVKLLQWEKSLICLLQVQSFEIFAFEVELL